MAVKRVILLDELRGLFIWGVVLYHLVYDLIYLFNVNIPLFHHFAVDIFQESVACGFIIISGACCYFSRDNMKRGGKLLLLAFAITVATTLVMPEYQIIFGILHLLAASILLFALLKPFWQKLPPLLILVAGLLLYLLTFHTMSGYWQIGTLTIFLPQTLKQIPGAFIFGFIDSSYYSADYFPLLPYGFIFFAGTALGKWLSQGHCPDFAYQNHAPFLALCGRGSLWIYLFHQPIILAVLFLIFS